MPLQLAGAYINLDRTPERDAFMQAQFARLGMQWVRRHSAVDGNLLALPEGCTLLPGEYACFLSHLQLIESAPADAWLLVLEDDAELSDHLPDLLGKALQGPMASADIAFLECQTHFSLAHVSHLWEIACRHIVEEDGKRKVLGMELVDARPFYRWGTNAYVLSPQGRAKLLPLLRQWLAEGPVRPIDVNIERAIALQQLRGVITLPFLATTSLRWHGRSTIGNGTRMPADALMVLRRVLFAGELGEATALAQRLEAPQGDAALHALAPVMLQIADFQRLEQQARRKTADERGSPRSNS